jgi:hypothetical protein
MEIILAVFLGGLALIYICSPLLSGASETARAGRQETWHSVEQLEIDREMGKIDQAEYEELKPRAPEPEPVATLPSVEELILGVRQQKRADVAIETEVLIARSRKKPDLN